MLYFSSVFNRIRRVTDKKAMRQDFGAENSPELEAMAAEDLAGWLLDLVNPLARSNVGLVNPLARSNVGLGNPLARSNVGLGNSLARSNVGLVNSLARSNVGAIWGAPGIAA